MSQSNRNRSFSTPRNGLTHKNKLGYIDPSIAGVDIGANLIHVAVPQRNGTVVVHEFGTTTPDLYKIAATLSEAGVTTAVMEATGVYWVPLFETLEDRGFIPVLVDAKSVKNVPGRKTDVHDAQWIQTLYSNGLLRAAFRPPLDRLTLRAYVRQRQSVIKDRQRDSFVSVFCSSAHMLSLPWIRQQHVAPDYVFQQSDRGQVIGVRRAYLHLTPIIAIPLNILLTHLC